MFWKMLGVNLDHPVVDFASKQPKISGKSCRERDWHRAVRRSERPPRSTKAEVINWWSADNFAFELNNSCIVGTNIFVWMPSLFFTYKVLFQIFWVALKQSPQQGDQDWRPVFFKTFLQQHLQYSEVRNFHTL